jgi:hypothetical protein
MSLKLYILYIYIYNVLKLEGNFFLEILNFLRRSLPRASSLYFFLPPLVTIFVVTTKDFNVFPLIHL